MKKSLILATSFAMALGVGVAVGAHHMKDVAKKVEAEGNVVYLKPGVWVGDSANFEVYSWGGAGGNQWFSMTPVATDTTVYEATIPNDKTGLSFVRMNPSGEAHNWDSKWNQTADLTYTAATPCYKITGWGDNDGEWEAYTPPAAASTYYYSLNGAADVEMTPSNDEVISESLSFKVGDELTFKKDSDAFAVTAKDDGLYTKVELVNDKLVFVQDYTGRLYLNISSAKLWAGEIDSGYYLNGSFSPEWNVKHALKASEKEGEAGTYEIKGVTVADDAEVKFMEFIHEQKDPNYINIDSTRLTIGGGIDAELTEGNNLKFNKGGTYDFYLNTTNNNWLTVDDPSYVPPEPDIPAEDGYYLVGTKTNWKYEGATKLAAGENGNKAQLINYSATAGEEFKVREYKNSTNTWYGWGDGHDQNYVVGESSKQLDIYINGEDHLWVQEHVEPDEPENDGYYLASSKSDLKFAGATPMSTEGTVGNVAELFNYNAAKDEVIKVRGFFDGEEPENKEGVYGGSAIEGVGAAGEDGTFVMSAANLIDVFAKWEESTLKYYITKHADRYNVTFNGYFFEGKNLEKPMEVVDTQRATEDVVFNVDEEALAKDDYELRGVYTDDTFEHEYVAAELEEATVLYVKYTKLCYYLTGDDTFLGTGHGWNVDYSAKIVEYQTSNRFEGTITVPEGVDAEHPMLVKPLKYGLSEGEDPHYGWLPAHYEMGINTDTGEKWVYSFASVDESGNFKFVESGTFAFYVYDTNKVTFNSGEYVFHSAFLTQVGGECKNDGSTDTAALKVIWGNMKTAFNALDSADQKKIKDIGFDGGDAESGDDRLRMIAKYNYIVTKYGTDEFEDFIWEKTRAPKVGNNVMFLNNSNNTGLIIIISVSAISVISIAAFLMLKKRKEK